MNNRRRGVALVINNIGFKNKEFAQRHGAEIDSENLQRVLSKLHFDVRLHHNQTKDEILNLLREASAADHSDADCFMCVVMSHGTKLPDGGLGVYGVDKEQIDIEAEAKSLFSNSKCPTLVNKPKLFFVDASWGNDTMPVKSIIPLNSTKTSPGSENVNNSITSNENLPNISDFLFSFCTLPNYASLRDMQKGNWFMQELTSTLDEFAEKRSLSDILNKVRQRLVRKTTTCHAQMSVDHSMLSRNVIFKSKNT